MVDEKLILKLYLEDNKTIREIAAIVDSSYYYVRNYLHDLGCVRAKNELRIINIDEELLKKLYINDCMSVLEISSKIGVSYSVVQKTLKKIGILLNVSEAAIKNRNIIASDEDVKRLYLNDHLSIMKIARMFGVGYWAISAKVNKLGIVRNYSDAQKFRWENSERERMSRQTEENWSNPTYKEKQILAIAKGNSHPMTSAEEKMLTFLDTNFSREFIFSGDGKLGNIEGKMPDFISTDGKKLIIEVLGCYWHHCVECGFGLAQIQNGKMKWDTMKDQEERQNIFTKNGYKSLFVWEHEIKDEENLMRKINQFIGE